MLDSDNCCRPRSGTNLKPRAHAHIDARHPLATSPPLLGVSDHPWTPTRRHNGGGGNPQGIVDSPKPSWRASSASGWQGLHDVPAHLRHHDFDRFLYHHSSKMLFCFGRSLDFLFCLCSVCVCVLLSVAYVYAFFCSSFFAFVTAYCSESSCVCVCSMSCVKHTVPFCAERRKARIKISRRNSESTRTTAPSPQLGNASLLDTLASVVEARPDLL